MPDNGVSARYRCSGCGNLTRFDVVSSRRTRAFHHFSVGGDLSIEGEEVLDARVEEVTCRWCGASGASIEEIPVDEVPVDEVPVDEMPVDEMPVDEMPVEAVE
ncbi:MAG: hypothetical protein WD271_04525 [Acidimicrobiia bacterium]